MKDRNRSWRRAAAVMAAAFIIAAQVRPAWAFPFANAGPDQAVNEGAVAVLDGSGSFDDQGRPITFSWAQTAGTPVTLSDPASATPSFTAPAVAANEVLSFQLTVTNDIGEQSIGGTNVTVVNVNQPPAADAGPDQTVNEGSGVTLNGSGSADPDGDPITFSWTQTAGTPVTLSDPASASPTFTAPQVGATEALVFELTVADPAGASAADTVSITVQDVAAPNQPPVANAGPDQTVNENSAAQLNGSASTDPEGGALVFTWTQIGGPVVALDNPLSPTPTFTAPPVNGNTVITFRLTVTDPGLLTATDEVAITVQNLQDNQPPTANAGPDQTVDEGAVVNASGSGSDPDGEAITFAWSQVSGPTIVFADPSAAQTTFTAPPVSETTLAVIRLTVTDARGATASDDANILIRNVNQVDPPVANAGPDQTVNEGAVVTLSGSATSSTGGPLTFQWTQVEGPPVALSNPSSQTPQFTAPNVTLTTALRFRLRVSDPAGRFTEDDVIVTVRDVAAAQPQEPVISNLIIAPNPFNPARRPASFRYVLASDSAVRITVYDLFGNVVTENDISPGSAGGRAGSNAFTWDGRNGEGDMVGNGGYIVHVQADDGRGRSEALRTKAGVYR